jgi:hypothetical protein
MAAFQTGNSHELQLICTCPGGLVIEANYHKRYDNDRIRGEWFLLSGEELEKIKEECENIRDDFFAEE